MKKILFGIALSLLCLPTFSKAQQNARLVAVKLLPEHVTQINNREVDRVWLKRTGPNTFESTTDPVRDYMVAPTAPDNPVLVEFCVEQWSQDLANYYQAMADATCMLQRTSARSSSCAIVEYYFWPNPDNCYTDPHLENIPSVKEEGEGWMIGD